jgi:hypothetical protein
MHQEFFQDAISYVIEIGNRAAKTVDPQMPSEEYCSFKATFEALSLFLNEYKKSVHEKTEEDITPASTEIMEVDAEKKVFIARCHQHSGPKDVCHIFSPD